MNRIINYLFPKYSKWKLLGAVKKYKPFSRRENNQTYGVYVRTNMDTNMEQFKEVYIASDFYTYYDYKND